MAQINLQPFLMRDVLLKISTTDTVPVEVGDFEKHVSQVQFDPSSSTVNWKGLTPTSGYTFGTTATWTCTLTYAQDWETVSSLSRYLFENEGVELTAVFEPVKGGPSVTATIIAAPGSIGGTVDQVGTATVTLGVNGKPTLEATA